MGTVKNKDKQAVVSEDHKMEKKSKKKVTINGDNNKKGKIEIANQNHDKVTIKTTLRVNLKSKKKRNKRKKLGVTALGADIGGFTVIGDVNQFKQLKVRRVLPEWLAHPFVVSCNLKDDTAPVGIFNLDPQIVKALEKNFIPYFFPVQQQVIPWLLEAHSPKLIRPSDICVSAPTGSGKTLAYTLPLVQILKKSMSSSVRAIVVLPTEVLASQVFSVFQTYCKGTNLKVFLMGKRTTLSAETRALVTTDLNGNSRCRYDIIVATPGRLIDHLEHTEGFDISNLRFLVVDEADRTLDDQEGDWLHRLEIKFWSYHKTGEVVHPWKSLPLNIKCMPIHLKAFHKLLFSATLSQNPENLEKLHLFQPKLFTSIVESKKGDDSQVSSNHVSKTEDELDEATLDSFVGKFTTPSELKESFVLCHRETKPLILTYLISHFKWKRVLCFANTNEATHRLCLLLSYMGNLQVREVSSKWSAHARDLVIKRFVDGQIDILVTSDQLARGIDIPLVDHVISYDMPSYTKTYVHRIGRTARAGREGHAVSLITNEQMGMFKKTMKSAGKSNVDKIPVKNSELREYEGKFKEALVQLKTKVEEEMADEKVYGGKKRRGQKPSTSNSTTISETNIDTNKSKDKKKSKHKHEKEESEVLEEGVKIKKSKRTNIK